MLAHTAAEAPEKPDSTRTRPAKDDAKASPGEIETFVDLALTIPFEWKQHGSQM